MHIHNPARSSARLLLTTGIVGIFALACSSNDGGSGGFGVGGTSAPTNGGATGSATGGSATTQKGGAANAGGSNAANGGTNASTLGGASAGGVSSGGANQGGASTGGASAGGASSGGNGSTNRGGSSATNVGGASAGKSSIGGAGGTNAGGASTGGAGKGGTATGGASVGGTATGGASQGGSSATGGASTGGAATGGASTGGAATGVAVAASCAALETTLKWPTANGTKTISGTQTVTGVYDGGMALHQGTLNDCNVGDQDSTKPIFDVEDGGTVQNVVFDTKIGDGIHCKGSCTIKNVWFNHVCDDAISILGSGTVNISNCGFKYARDKTIQHNGTATVNIDTVYIETAGKLYRSCGDGCSTSTKRTATIKNVIAVGAAEVAGLSTNDKVTLSNICMYRTPKMCETYEPGSSTKTTIGANGTDEGPTTNCIYNPAEAHALVDLVNGSLPTQIMCPGPNSAAAGQNCIPGFETCLRNCTPGSYGFKPLTCSGGKYVEATTCAMPKDTTAATNLNGATKAASASGTQTKNNTCSTQWAWSKDSASSANYCVCVYKPGYYQESTGSAPPATWTVWDCASPWWL